jgi:lipopolysaccharide export system protein LptA
MYFFCVRLFFSAVVLLLFFPPAASAEDSSNLSEKELKLKKAISISSKKMIVNNLEGFMIFDGDVKVIKGDLTLTSDRVKIYFKNEKGKKESKLEASPGEREISLMEAEGNVHIVKGTREARSDKAEYHQEEEVIILTGSPQGWDNQYKISGTKMTIYLKEDRSEIEGSNVLFNPAAK